MCIRDRLRPTVVGYTFSIWGLCSPQLRAGQPSAGKQGFAYSIMTCLLYTSLEIASNVKIRIDKNSIFAAAADANSNQAAK